MRVFNYEIYVWGRFSLFIGFIVETKLRCTFRIPQKLIHYKWWNRLRKLSKMLTSYPQRAQQNMQTAFVAHEPLLRLSYWIDEFCSNRRCFHWLRERGNFMRNFKIQSRVLRRIKFISTCPSELRAINEWLSEWAQGEWLRDLREFESHLAILSCRMRADEEANKKQPKRLLCRKARRNRTNWFFCCGTWQKCEQEDVSQKLQKGEHIQKRFTSPVIMKTFGGEWCVGDVLDRECGAEEACWSFVATLIS